MISLSLSPRLKLFACFARAERVMDDGDREGADVALYAADRAQKRGSSDDAVLDALEAAEAAYAEQHRDGEARALSPCPSPSSR